MAFRVDLTARAEADLEALYLWVTERAPHRGPAWFKAIEAAILSLGEHPERCPIAPESFDPARPVRVLLQGRPPNVYRIFYATDLPRKAIHIVHIRHAARQPAGPDELSVR